MEASKASRVRRSRAGGVLLAALTLLFSISVAVNAVQYLEHRSLSADYLETYEPDWYAEMRVGRNYGPHGIFDCPDTEPVQQWRPIDFRICPDYTATVEFGDYDSPTPPKLNHVKDSAGNFLIELKAAWHPQNCPSAENCYVMRWVVTPVFHNTVNGYGFNIQNPPGYASPWDGPKRFSDGAINSLSAENAKVEIYAVDSILYKDTPGTPIPEDRYGSCGPRGCQPPS